MSCVSLRAASQVLEKHEDEFFEVVDAKHNLHRLKRKKVITDHLIMEIENTDDETAKELLFHHLHRNADVATLREYCKMAIEAYAFPKMQKLGEKMLSELATEGLLEWCVCVYVYANDIRTLCVAAGNIGFITHCMYCWHRNDIL